MAKVPKLDFTSYNFAAPLTMLDYEAVHYADYCYRGPGRLVQRIAKAVGAQGQILPIITPLTQCQLEFRLLGSISTVQQRRRARL
jgi:hypothetical protein